MSYKNKYPPAKTSAFMEQTLRKEYASRWSVFSEETDLEGFACSQEFKSTLDWLAKQRQRDTQTVVKDALWDTIECNYTVWLNRGTYYGNAQVMFRCSQQLQEACTLFCRKSGCNLTTLCKQSILYWFEYSQTDFNSLVKERGGSGL